MKRKNIYVSSLKTLFPEAKISVFFIFSIPEVKKGFKMLYFAF
jgi:hypothetical protein